MRRNSLCEGLACGQRVGAVESKPASPARDSSRAAPTTAPAVLPLASASYKCTTAGRRPAPHHNAAPTFSGDTERVNMDSSGVTHGSSSALPS